MNPLRFYEREDAAKTLRELAEMVEKGEAMISNVTVGLEPGMTDLEIKFMIPPKRKERVWPATSG